MNGITVLSDSIKIVDSIMLKSVLATILCFLCLVAVILGAIKFDWKMIFLNVVVIPMCILSIFCIFKSAQPLHIQKILIEDDVSFKYIEGHYDILDKDGDIYKVIVKDEG